jgi:ribosomal protein S18 acetylase RimI-like enzyme
MGESGQVSDPNDPLIRLARPSDLDDLYEIGLRTGAAGKDATDLMDDPRLLGDLFVAPYAIFEPELAFVLDDGTGRAQGYVVGALDCRAFEARCEQEWWPAVRARHPGPTGGSGLDDIFIAYLHGNTSADEAAVADHPSELHIDLLPAFQDGGWGRRMMTTLLDALRAAGSPGVHLGVHVANERAVGFYRHLGFRELGTNRITRTFGMPLT